MTASQETWRLTFKPVGNGPEGAIRVRKVLKYALRACGLKATSIGEPTQEPSATAAEQPHILTHSGVLDVMEEKEHDHWPEDGIRIRLVSPSGSFIVLDQLYAARPRAGDVVAADGKLWAIQPGGVWQRTLSMRGNHHGDDPGLTATQMWRLNLVVTELGPIPKQWQRRFPLGAAAPVPPEDPASAPITTPGAAQPAKPTRERTLEKVGSR